MDEAPKLTPLEALAAHVRDVLGDKIDDHAIAYGELTLTTHADSILDVAGFLRDDAQCRFVSIVDICGVDYPDREQRFDVVYHLLSPTRNLRIRVKLPTDDTTLVPSLTAIYPGADWYEREAYDFYGILFSGHPDLRRLLTDYGCDGLTMR